VFASVVIDRTYSRQFLPKSSSPRTLCLSVEFSDSLRPTSVVPTTYALLLARPFLNPFAINPLRTLFISTGVCPLWPYPTTAIPSTAYSFLPISFIFNILRTILRFFALPKKSTLLFSSDSALFEKKRGLGEWVSQRSASFWKFSMVKVGNSLRSTTRQSRVTKLGLG